MSTVDIIIKSYYRDFKWLKFALDSITRNVAGYNSIILMIPMDDARLFDATIKHPPRTEVRYVDEYGNGYLYQQWCKIKAYRYSRASYLLFGDSDCIFTRPVDLQDYIKDGRPEILHTSWDKVGDAIIWKAPTEKIMAEDVPYEFMRRNNMIYHTDTLIHLNDDFPDLEKTIMNSSSFSEFNLIGAYAYKNERGRYNFINTDSWDYTEPKAIQFWSHASKGLDASEAHLKEYIRALQTIMSGYGIEPITCVGTTNEGLRECIEQLEKVMMGYGIEPPKDNL